MTNNLTREQWMLANALAGVVNAVGEREEREAINLDSNYVANVASELSRICSRLAIEDTVQILETALDNFKAIRGSDIHQN